MTKPQSAVQLTYIGGPTLLIEFAGLRFLTDPTFDPSGSEATNGPVTLTKTAGPAVSTAELGHIDAVLLSHHHHYDNLDQAGRKILPQAGQIITTPEGASPIEGNAVGLRTWGHVDIVAPDARKVRVISTPARHGPAEADRGPVTGFVLQLAGDPGPAIYVSGDTVWFAGVEETIRRFPQIAVAVLFLGAARIPIVDSHLTFTAEEAVRFARNVPLAGIVPVHFEGWKHFSESREKIEQAFSAAGLQKNLHWLKAGIREELQLARFIQAASPRSASPPN